MFINKELIKFWYIYTMSSIQKNKVILYVLECKDIPNTLSFLESNFLRVYSKILFLLQIMCIILER